MNKQKVAVVTGASSGIGLTTCLRLADLGFKVFGADINDDKKNDGIFAEKQISFIKCDVANGPMVQHLVATAAKYTGHIHALVNCAGVNLVKQIPDVSEAEWDHCLDINLKGTFLLTKFVVPSMIAAGGGAIVNISSNAGILPRAADPIYSTSKASMIAFTKATALSHACNKITANVICPGPVSGTKLIDQNIASKPDRRQAEIDIIKQSPLCHAYAEMISTREVVHAVEFFLSEMSRFVTGTVLAIDGGKSLGVAPVAQN